jgi:Zn-dependent protease with chaperone function
MMKYIARILLAASWLVIVDGGVGYGQVVKSPSPSPPAAPSVPHPSQAQRASPLPPATYTLTPERRAQAIAYSRALYILYFVGALISIGIYLFLWRARISVLFRDWAVKTSRRLFIQCLIVVPLTVAATALLKFPLHYYASFVLEHRFGLATQGFASWLADWGKSLAIEAALGVIVVWVFYFVVRRSPGRWWFLFWLASIPLVLGFILIEPYAIDPWFYKFTPLENSQPVLTGRIEAMLEHARLAVPPARIFEMNASSRTNAVDAYVTGVGASKRVVVWDTTLKTMGSDELLLVLGHEIGHYVLHHIPKEFGLDEAVALIFFFLGFFAVNRLVNRAGPCVGIEGVGDLASLPLVLAVLIGLAFLSDPIMSGISRYYEHQADQFGLEVAYGVVPDPNTAEVHALQILGEQDLADPDPSPFIKFWLYTHPPLADRIRFAATYKPWSEGKPLRLLQPK